MVPTERFGRLLGIRFPNYREEVLEIRMEGFPLKILGVDPGLNITGYSVLEVTDGSLQVCEAGIVKSRSRGNLADRVHSIHEGITSVIDSFAPAAVALEELFSHYKRPRTSILMGHARGVICLAAAQAGLEVHSYSATQVKRILTGNGRAPKNQMQLAIMRELNLETVPEPADVADALAIALCHHYLAKRNLPI